MKKRLTAWLLAMAMLCTAVPAAFATSGPEDVVTGGVNIQSLLEDTSDKGYLITTRDEIPAGTEILDAEVRSDFKLSESAQEIEPVERMEVYSEELDGATVSDTRAEYTTDSFSTYGEQLADLVIQINDKVYSVGSSLKKMYDTYRSDVRKGANSQCLLDSSSDYMENFAVTLQLSGAQLTSEMASAIISDLAWTTYRCLDFDEPQMFYSNGYCGMSGSYTSSMVSFYFRPLYGAYFEDSQALRISLNEQLHDVADQVVREAAYYPRAYDKMKYFHDWLCENNDYNYAAVESSDYPITVSGTPWSCVGGILSNSVEGVEGPVCEGYSRAFQLLCQKAGITATVITSDSGVHMWNNLRYGQYWSGVDVTWDDGNDGTYNHNYFLQQVNNMSGHEVDDATFVSWLEYPNLSVIADSTVLPFYDVSDSFWGRDYIQQVYDRDYMSGLTCVNFGISSTLTREQFAQILYSIAGKPAVEYTDRFTDVPDGQWYTSAVLWADENGIANGVSDTRFGVGNSITREQLALMLYQYCGATETPEGYIDSFDDAAKVSDWARTAMNWAVKEGVMSGDNKNRLNPTGKATRSESAVMICGAIIEDQQAAA